MSKTLPRYFACMNDFAQAPAQFVRTLRALDTVLRKAEEYASERGFPVDNFIAQRLFPDMLPFVSQVRIACDMAKATTANLSGQAAPRHEDDETTFGQLHARIESVIGYLQSVPKEAFESMQPDNVVPIPFPKEKAMYAIEYLFGRQLPNFFFHVSMAYALLRVGGVPLGKADFIGADLQLLDD